MASLPAPLLLPLQGDLGMQLTLPHLFAAGLLSPDFRVDAFMQRIVYLWILERIYRELRSGCFLELTAALYSVCVKALNVDLGLHL